MISSTNNYAITGKDRDSYEGGVLIAVNNNYPSLPLYIDTELETTIHFCNSDDDDNNNDNKDHGRDSHS